VSLGKKLLHEAKSAGLVTLYFLFAFGLIMLLMKLFVARYEIEISEWSKVIIGALIIGKVVVVLDNTSWGKRFHGHRGIYDILYRSAIYTAVVLVVAMLEQLFHAYGEAGSLTAAFNHMIEHRVEGKFFGNMLMIGLSFVVLNTILAFNHALGPGTVRRVLLSKRVADD